MNRLLAAVLVAATLIVGLAIGVGVGGLAGSAASPSPAIARAGESPTPTQAPSSTSGSASSQAPVTPSPSPTPTPTPTPEPTPVLLPAPLTGEPVRPSLARRHVIAVMIDDLYAARPQSGLSEAGVVWQAPAEGGIPRYMALFQDGDPPNVGPVRSARLYYVAWAAEWNAVYVHAGGSPQANQFLASSAGRKAVFNANALVWERAYFRRISSRFAPHNLYTTGKQLRKLTSRVGAKPIDRGPIWKFAPDADISQRPQGGKIIVPYPYNRIMYRYDRTTNTYKRSVSVEGKQVDAATKVRIAPRNVIVMFMRFGPLNDGTHKHRLEANFTGSGVAYIATNGKTIKGTWKKKSMKGPTRFYDKNGNQVTLTIGQTFVQVVPVGTSITIQDGTVPTTP